MKNSHSLNHLALDHLACTDPRVTRQTIKESKIIHSADLGRGVSVHHGTRDGLAIVIVELEEQTSTELSCVWFNESN